MAASSAAGSQRVYQCRGLRKWYVNCSWLSRLCLTRHFPCRCDARCDAFTLRRPTGYPAVGYYCGLHKCQAPVPDKESGSVRAPEKYTSFLLTRVDSFRSEEELLLTELVKAQRGAGTVTKTGQEVLDWLTTDRKLTYAQALSSAGRMLVAKLLTPAIAGLASTTLQKQVKYRVHDPEQVRALSK